MFFDEAQAIEIERRADFVEDVRAAVWAEGKELFRITDAMRGAGRDGETD